MRPRWIQIGVVCLIASVSDSAAQNPSPQNFTPDQIKRGTALFDRNCSPCHGAHMADPESAFDLRTFPHDQHARFVNSVTNGKNNMPTWGGLLKPDEIEALWSYVVTGGKIPDQAAGPSSGLVIGGAVGTPLSLSLADLKSMPRTTVRVLNPHNKKTEVYEGVSLESLLHKSGAPAGDKIRGPLLASYLVAEAADGYRVIFSLAEVDSGFLDSEILVADTLDGAALGPEEGPFKLVAPHEKRPARWVRMIKSITLVQLPK